MMTALPLDRHVYCISLEGSSRWSATAHEIRTHGFPTVQPFAAVRGANLPHEQLEQYVTPRALRCIRQKHVRTQPEDIDSVGAVGCYLSHLTLIQQQVQQQWPYLVVFEDDVRFKDTFVVQFQRMLEQLESADPEWEMFVFAPISGRDIFRKRESVEGARDVVRITGMFYGTAGYVLTLSGARKIVGPAFPMDVQVDAYFGLLAEPHRTDPLRLYMPRRTIAHQDSMFTTTIHTPIWHENKKMFVPETARGQSVLLAILLLILWGIYRLGKWRGARKREALHNTQRTSISDS